jgi:hypothetical protein
MSRLNPSELPGTMVVLGLVIEEPGQTVKHIGSTLDRRFKRSNFSRSTAQNSMKTLAGLKYVRQTHKVGRGGSNDCYVATPKGEQVFHAWMYDLPNGSGPHPTLREAMYGRIELCRDEDIPRLLDLAREEVVVSIDLYQAASKRLMRHENAAKRLTQAKPGTKAPTKRVREILMHVEPLHWSHRAERYELIAEALEEVIADMQGSVSGT